MAETRLNSARFLTHSLEIAPRGAQVARVLSAAIRAVDPRKAVLSHLSRQGNQLVVAGRIYDLGQFERILVVGAGKAGAPMTAAVSETLGDKVAGGVVIVKEGYAGGYQASIPVTLVEAGHPIPDQRGVIATGRLISMLHTSKPDDLVICLISGGASALLVSPVEDLSLAQLQRVTSALLASGADIQAINTVRKHLERIKGGQLARLASPSQVLTLILSDVVGDPLEAIGSGPTAPDQTTFGDACQVLERYRLLDQVPSKVVEYLQRGRRGEVGETPKPTDSLFDHIQNVIIGSNAIATEAALAQARQEGFNALLLTTFLQGEARHAGRLLASIARQVDATGQPASRPACLIAGGETTVTLRGDGLGGRNQELALAAVSELHGLRDVALVALATDGGDGPTDAAGAVVTGETLARARQAGLDPVDYLARNDAYNFFDPLGDLLKPGPTQTNVNDLVFIFTF